MHNEIVYSQHSSHVPKPKTNCDRMISAMCVCVDCTYGAQLCRSRSPIYVYIAHTTTQFEKVCAWVCVCANGNSARVCSLVLDSWWLRYAGVHSARSNRYMRKSSVYTHTYVRHISRGLGLGLVVGRAQSAYIFIAVTARLCMRIQCDWSSCRARTLYSERLPQEVRSYSYSRIIVSIYLYIVIYTPHVRDW